MTNAELISKIKAEIERRIGAIAKAPSDNGVMDSINGARGHELMKLLSFLSTLESEKPNNHEGIDKKAGKRLRRVCNLAEELKEDRPLEERLQELKEIRAKKDLDEAAEEAATEVYTYTFQGMDDLIGLFKAGAKWQKEQMLNEAVEGEVICYNDDTYAVESYCFDNKEHHHHSGDKVRIIIVKED